MTVEELAPDELAALEEYRRKRDLEKEHKAQSVEILNTAAHYLNWLQINGSFTSYSTFCNDFGYEGKNRSEIYETVTAIIRLATDKSREILYGQPQPTYPTRSE